MKLSIFVQACARLSKIGKIGKYHYTSKQRFNKIKIFAQSLYSGLFLAFQFESYVDFFAFPLPKLYFFQIISYSVAEQVFAFSRSHGLNFRSPSKREA